MAGEGRSTPDVRRGRGNRPGGPPEEELSLEDPEDEEEDEELEGEIEEGTVPSDEENKKADGK